MGTQELLIYEKNKKFENVDQLTFCDGVQWYILGYWALIYERKKGHFLNTIDKYNSFKSQIISQEALKTEKTENFIFNVHM